MSKGKVCPVLPHIDLSVWIYCSVFQTRHSDNEKNF